MKKLPILIAIAGCLSQGAHAQTPAATSVWHKTITRQVIVNDTTMLNNKNKKTSGDNEFLAEMLLKAAISGKIHAYRYNYEGGISTQYEINALKSLINGPSDTMIVEDPSTGKKLQRVVTQEPEYWAMTRFNVMEDWTMNKSNGKVSMQIMAIAPKRPVYGATEHELRGYQMVAWFKYEEIASYLQKYESENPNANLNLQLWNDIMVDN